MATGSNEGAGNGARKAAMFKLEIEMGNDAMLSAQDVAHELRRVADRLTVFSFRTADAGLVRDDNGNTVGKWELEAQR